MGHMPLRPCSMINALLSLCRQAVAPGAPALALALALAWPAVPPVNAARQGEGFTSTAFLHDTVSVNEEYENLLRLVIKDSLAANIQHLQDYGTRYAYTPQSSRAGRWLIRRLAGLGYADTLYQSLWLGNDKIKIATGNVSALKWGVRRPECRVIIGSHYDSITFGQPVSPAEEAPGADDNASGTSGVIEVARLLTKVELDATVQFTSFTGHEVGMLGSYEFATDLVEKGVSPEKIFFLNLDMIGNANGPPPWGVKIHDNVPSRALAELAARIGEAYTPLIPHMSGVRMADHTNFHDQGYRAIFLHEGDFNTANYHSRTDLLKNLEMDYEKLVVQMALAIVLHLANLAEPPENLMAAQDESGGLLVSWIHSLDADVIGYQVEVLDEAGGLIHEVFTSENHVLLDSNSLRPGCSVRVRTVDALGAGDASAPVLVGTGAGLLVSASPNPSGGPCRFDIFIPGSGAPVESTVKLVDAMGRLVATVHDAPLKRGSNVLTWNGALSSGERAPGGIFFYVVETKGAGAMRGKLALVR